MGSFNLIDDPWIEVALHNGEQKELGLADVFKSAESIHSIVGDLPTVSVAIEGILQAIIRRAVWQEATDIDEHQDLILDLWASWNSALEMILPYLEEWKDRFDLRHPSDPFFQVPDLRTSKDETKSLSILIPDMGSDKEALFTMRAGSSVNKIRWAEAARWLIHVQAFDVAGIRSGAVGDRRVKGGKGYPIGPGWTAQIGVVTPRLSNLKESLLLSIPPSGVGELNFDVEADLPAWERPTLTSEEEVIGGRAPFGPADLATWQGRRVRLIGDDSGVTQVVLAQGDRATPQNRQNLEPRTSWRYSDPQSKKFKEIVYMPRELNPETAMWRGLEALFPSAATMVKKVKDKDGKVTETAKFLIPATVEWTAALSNVLDSPLENREVNLESVGVVLGSNQSVTDEIIQDYLEFPAALLDDDHRHWRIEARNWAVLAEEVSRAIATFTGQLAEAAGADTTDGLRGRARRDYLTAVEPYYRKLINVAGTNVCPDIPTVREKWRRTLWRLADQIRRELLDEFGPSALVGIKKSVGGTDSSFRVSAGSAERWLSRKLGELLGGPDAANASPDTERNAE